MINLLKEQSKNSLTVAKRDFSLEVATAKYMEIFRQETQEKENKNRIDGLKVQILF